LEDDLSDSILRRSKIGVSTPIFKVVKGVDFMEIDLIPGSNEQELTMTDLQRVMRGKNFVIVRMNGESGEIIKGILEIENCGDRIHQIMYSKLEQITCEAQIEVGLIRMEIEKIDITNRTIHPNMLLGLMWKTKWVGVEGINSELSIENKIKMIRE